MTPSIRDIPYFADAGRDAIAAAEQDASWFSIPGGSPLFLEGEPADGICFVISGSLAAFDETQSPPRLIGYIRAGEPVGEMAMISGEPHSASVYAVRDTELVRISARSFERLDRLHPPLMRRVAQLMLARARANVRPRARAEPKVYALLSTSPTIDLKLRARTLVDALAKLGKRACVVGEEAADMLSAWYDALEQSNDAVFLISPVADTSWFRICLRQADRIWVLGRADAVPSYPLLPDDPSPARQFQLVDFVLLHHGSDRKAASPEQWRTACGAARIFHWRGLADADAMRLARVIAGRAVGLVLSGGGARAYAHLGVLRALREAGVPIDAVGGTSMGAIVAACFAMGWSDDEIEARIRDAFVTSNPLGDYVLPVVSLSRGKRVEQRLHAHFGDAMIEDMCTPFFCVATDLVAGAPVVRRSGLLRTALRGSISLPGILPPVVSEDGRALYVDGAVTDNFPVAVMAEQHRGPIIGVDVARRNVIEPSKFADAPDFMGWVASRGFQSYPPIAELLMSAATVSAPLSKGRDRVDLLVVPEMPGVNLRDWKRFDEAVASGYQATVDALTKRPEALSGEASVALDPHASSVPADDTLLARA